LHIAIRGLKGQRSNIWARVFVLLDTSKTYGSGGAIGTSFPKWLRTRRVLVFIKVLAIESGDIYTCP